MDIKQQIEKVVSSISGDASLKEKFSKDPIGTVKSIVGLLPDEVVEKLVEGVKAKLTADKLSDAAGALGKLFKK